MSFRVGVGQADSSIRRWHLAFAGCRSFSGPVPLLLLMRAWSLHGHRDRGNGDSSSAVRSGNPVPTRYVSSSIRGGPLTWTSRSDPPRSWCPPATPSAWLSAARTTSTRVTSASRLRSPASRTSSPVAARSSMTTRTTVYPGVRWNDDRASNRSSVLCPRPGDFAQSSRA